MAAELRAIATLVVMLFTSAEVSAQSAWEVPAPEFPAPVTSRRIGESTTPFVLLGPLVEGRRYAVETIDLVDATPLGADPVITILGDLGDRPLVLGGADDVAQCYPDELGQEAACATFVAPPPRAPFTVSTATALIRAHTHVRGGTLRLRVREISADAAVPTDNRNCPPRTTTVGTACWTLATRLPRSFGGLVHDVGDNADAFNFNTRDDVYSAASSTGLHHIWLTGDNESPEQNWRIVAHSTAIAHEVAGNVQHVGVLPTGTATVVAGTSGQSNLVLQRNDRVRLSDPQLPPIGEDFDNDTLGAALEAILGTCDRTTTAIPEGSPPGTTCLLRNCEIESSAACRTSLNDSDQDAIPDPIDLYGYRSNGSQFLRLAQMGCRPNQYDSLVEADPHWVNRLAAPGCTYTDASSIDWREALQHANSFQGSGPAVTNRNGRVGIQMHYDIPLPATDTVLGTPPAWVPGFGDGTRCVTTGSTVDLSGCLRGTQDPRAGYWGGAVCSRPIFCQDGCPLGEACIRNGGICAPSGRSEGCVIGSECPPIRPGLPPEECVDQIDTCDFTRQRDVWLSPGRRWLFRHQLNLDFGGNARVYPQMTSFVGPYASGHELAHNGNLSHAGPYDVFGYDDLNGRPNHNSRINYLLQQYGYVGTTPALDPLRLDQWSRVTFSDGSLASLDPTAAVEDCPFGPATHPYYGVLRSLGLMASSDPTSCLVDWDGDRGALLAPDTVEASLWQNLDRVRRAPRTLVTVSAYQPSELVVMGPEIVAFRFQRHAEEDAGAYLTFSNGHEYSCSDLPASPIGTNGPRWDTCDFGASPSFEDTLPVIQNAALNVVVPNGAFAVESLRGPGDSEDPAALLVWREGRNQLRYGVFRRGAPWLEPAGEIPAARPFPLPSATRVTSLFLLGMARLGDSERVSLVYRAPGGDILEQVFSVGPSGPTWSPPASTGASCFNGSPGLTPLESGALTDPRPGGGAGGRPPLAPGALMACADRDGRLQLYHRATSAAVTNPARWQRIASLPQTFDFFAATDTVRGQPQLAVSRMRRGERSETHLFAAVSTARIGSGIVSLVSRSVAGSASFAGRTWEYVNRADVWATSAASTLLTDGRSDPPLLRGIVARLFNPDVPRAPPCPPGTSRGIWESAVTCISPNGRFVAVEEFRSGEIDGTTPGILESFDEWSTLVHYFCEGVRLQRPVAPFPWRGEVGDSCTVAPVFP